MSDELVAFLRARLDEDEQVARAAIRQHEPAVAAFKVGRPADMEDMPEEDAAHWSGGSDEDETGYFRSAVWAGDGIATICEMHSEYDWASPAHIARHDPVRVIAEVGMKRQILDTIVPSLEAAIEKIEKEWVTDWRPGRAEDLLRLLALPYAGHPDYREEWKP